MTNAKEGLKLEICKVLNEDCPSTLENHLDEVFPGIFIGGEFAAKSTEILSSHGITHVLNAAYVSGKTHYFSFGIVKTDQDWYDVRQYKCTFKGFEAVDTPGFNLSKYFDEAADFIESALTQNGKVLVHCYVGMSRSATLVIVYLMIKKGMSAKDAIALIRQKRACHPNYGFVDQLAELELKLNGNL